MISCNPLIWRGEEVGYKKDNHFKNFSNLIIIQLECLKQLLSNLYFCPVNLKKEIVIVWHRNLPFRKEHAISVRLK